MKKKIILVGLCIACTFLIIVLSLYFYAKTDHAKNLLVHKINAAIPGTLSAETIAVSFINSYIRLNGIQIKDRQGNTCFKFNHLLIDIKISSLFKTVLEIRELTVNGLEISLVVDADGRINLMDALIQNQQKSAGKKTSKKTEKGLPINVVIKKAQVIEGAFTFNTPDKQIKLRSLNIDITDANLLKQHLSLAARLKNSSITLKDKEILIQNLSFLSELEQGSTLDFNADLESNLCVFKATGKAGNIVTAPEIDFNITSISHLEEFNRFSKGTMDLGGLATMTLTGKGPVNNPEIRFNLDVANPRVDETLKGGNINVSAHLVDKLFSIKKGSLDLLGSTIEFNGMADLKDVFPKGFLNPARNLDNLKYEFSFDQKNGNFQHLEKWVKGISGRFSSSAALSGKGIWPKTLTADYHVKVALENFKQNRPETDFLDFETDIKGTIEKGICKITTLNAKTGETNLDAMGQYDLFKKNLITDLDINSQDLYPTTLALGIPPVKGAVNSKIKIAGPITHPEITARIFGKNLMTQGLFIDSLEFEGYLSPSGQVTIQQLVVKDQDLVIDVKGSADVFKNAFTIKDVIKTNIQVLGQNINPGRFFAQGEVKNPPALLNSLIHLDLNMDAAWAIGIPMDKTSFYERAIPVKNIHAAIDLKKRKLEIILENIAALAGSLDTQTHQYHARIDFSHSDLAPLFKSAGMNGIQAHVDGQITAAGTIPVELSEGIINGLDSARGTLTLNADMSGSFKEPDGNIGLDLSNLSYDLEHPGIAISNLNGTLTATPDKIKINDLKAVVNDGRVSLAGNIRLKNYHIQDGRLTVFADNFDIPIPSKTGVEKSIFMEKFASDLDIHLQYDDTALQNKENGIEKKIPIKNIQANLNLDNLNFSVLLDKTADLKAALDPENSAYDLTLTFRQTRLDQIFKTAGFHEIKGSIDGHVKSKGKINPALPREMVEGLKRATGKLTGNATLNGSLEKPDFDVVITLEGLGYPLPQAGTSISNLNGKIKILDDVLEIENMVADLDKGNLSIKGKIGLQEYTPVKADIRFKGNNIALELPDMAQIKFNSDLAFSGTREKSDLSGTLLMMKGLYYKDFTFDLAEALNDKKRTSSMPKDKDTTDFPLIENTSLNIDVDYKEPFVVDNNLAYILIEPDINISGTAASPIITGRARILEGTVTYLKKEFKIEKGIIDFTDPYKIDPYIDLAAKTQIRNWTIFLELSGKTDNLKFNLSSKPEETQQDIMSLLIAGKTTKELGGSTKGAYTKILADKATEIIGKNVETSTPLDSFKIGYGGSEGSTVSVTLGKKLSKRLEILYSMKTEDEGTVHTNAAEYKIMENILVKAFNDSQGMSGAELTFKLEFR